MGSGERKQRRHQARRMEILRAASRNFRDQGFAATGMRDIAAAADLSPGSLYHYFKGKKELLYFCQEQALARMQAAAAEAARSDAPCAARLHRLITTHVRCVLDEVEGSAVHLEADGLPDRLRGGLRASRNRYEKGMRRIVEAGIASGEFVACDPGLVAKAILGALNWTTRWYRPEGPRTAEAIGRTFADFLVRGLVVSSRKGIRSRPAARQDRARPGRRQP